MGEKMEKLEQIKHDVNRTITHNIDWFTPEDEKNLVGSLLISAIAEPLLLEFLKAIASEAGKLLFTTVVQYIKIAAPGRLLRSTDLPRKNWRRRLLGLAAPPVG